MSDERKIKPVQPGGFNDYTPAQVAARSRMIDTIRGVYELFGFQPLDTPCVEFLEVLTGEGGDTEKEIFHLVGTDEDKDLALRFDLTVPLSRYVAANTELLLPFKRYQVGPCFRGEKPQAGRFRQFLQIDADIVGARTGLADAEIVAVTVAAMQALGVNDFVVRINNRKIHDGLAEALGIAGRGPFGREAMVNELLRVMDKVDKIGRDGLRAELRRKPQGEYDRALELTPAQVELIDRFLDTAGDNRAKLATLDELIKGETGGAGLAELREILGHLEALGCGDRVQIDLSVARGLEYYTGPVLETTLLDLPEIGSVASGGRYDRMIGRFHANPIAATGVSIGLDRLFDALSKLDLVASAGGGVEAVIVVFDPTLMPTYLRFLCELRTANISSEIYLGADSGFKAQMRYALRKGARFLIICGGDEAARGGVQVKDLAARAQEFVREADLVDYLRRHK